VIEVEGHTDSDGSEGMNQTLSENRAGAVRDYLLSQGVPEASIVSRGFGEAHPVATNDTAEGKSQNRRVEIVVSGTPIGAETAGH
jgi:outer membrane protein OmpA-like peptidoglycan-associated protein